MTETSTDNQNQDDPAGLRRKLDQALETNRKLTVENTLFKAGLGHLNDAQTHALTITLPKGTEITADSLKGQATALGFPLEAPQPPPANDGTPPATPPPGNQPPPPGTPPGTPPADGSVPPTYDPGTQWLQPAPNSAHPDPRVGVAIQGVTQQEEAHLMALRAAAGGTIGGNLDEALAKAGSKEEALAAIRQHGAGAGIMLDSDLV